MIGNILEDLDGLWKEGMKGLQKLHVKMEESSKAIDQSVLTPIAKRCNSSIDDPTTERDLTSMDASQ
jgi:hypothetical protein